MISNLKAIDLFCGCGGMSVGLQQAGFTLLGGFDNDVAALKTYKLNFGINKGFLSDLSVMTPTELGDLFNLVPEELDILVGGPPCQGFSKNVPRSKRREDDPRNLLIENTLQFIEYLQPKVVLLENVAEIIEGYSGVYFDKIFDRLSRIGYNVEAKTIYAPDLGVPQNRRRAFFFANRLGRPTVFPLSTHKEASAVTNSNLNTKINLYTTVYDAIGDLPSLSHGEGMEGITYEFPAMTDYQRAMRKNSLAIYNHVARPLTPIQSERIQSLNAGQGFNDLPDHLRPRSGYSGAYGRMDWDKVAPTITRSVFHPGSGKFGHPTDIRVITIREAARFQSFPDDFRFYGTYIQQSHQVGNAVPPLIAKSFGDKAIEFLK